MKYNWSAVVNEFRQILIENVRFESDNPEYQYEVMFKDEVLNTDRFHPFTSDGQLSAALARIPQRVNYRSIKSYWANKKARWAIEDALDEMFYELEDTITYYYSNRWNFEPGFHLPKGVIFCWESISSEKLIRRILRAARKP